MYGEFDDYDADELVLFIENNEALYLGQFKSIIINLAKKIKKGVYEAEKAVKLWKYLADSGAKKYHKEIIKNHTKWFHCFSVKVRLEAAQQMEKYYREQLRMNEYSEWFDIEK